MTGAKALPCPFCGGMDLHRIETPENHEFDDMVISAVDYVHCNSCGASGPQHREDDLTGWAGWNAREKGRMDA